MPSLWPEALRQTKLSNPVHCILEARSRSGYSGRETIVALWGRHLGFLPHSQPTPHQPPFTWLCSTSLDPGLPQTLWHHCPADRKHKESWKKGCLLFIHHEWAPWFCCLSYLYWTFRLNTVVQTIRKRWKKVAIATLALLPKLCRYPKGNCRIENTHNLLNGCCTNFIYTSMNRTYHKPLFVVHYSV